MKYNIKSKAANMFNVCTITLRLHAYFVRIFILCWRLCNELRDRDEERRGETDKNEIKIARLKKEDKQRSIHTKIELKGGRIGNERWCCCSVSPSTQCIICGAYAIRMYPPVHIASP